MSLSILHFSDIHLKTESNMIESRLDKLKQACVSALPYGNDTVILISGDIAFSGKEAEYTVAQKMIDTIKDYLVEQRNANVHVCFVPGNHDCDFALSNSVRDLLVNTVKAADIDEKVFKEISGVQQAYRFFSTKYNTTSEELIYTKELNVSGSRILFVLINSAWMSVLKETPGHLLLPKQLFPKIDTRNYKMVVSVLHHPLSWLHQDSIPDVHAFLRETTDVLFVGHEHRKDSYRVQGSKWSFKQFQGRELQNSEGDDSAFTIHNFDGGLQTCESVDFEWDPASAEYERKGTETWQYHKNPAVCNSVFQPNQEALNKLNDIGILLTHFSKEDISLRDLFVWPELRKIDPYSELASCEKIRANVLQTIVNEQLAVVIGGSTYGKTALAKMIALSFIEEDICCLYMDGHTIKASNVDALSKSIETTFIEQYSPDNLERFRQLPIEQRMIIIDDFDSVSTRGNRRDAMLEHLSHYFGKVILFVPSDFEMFSILSCPCFRRLSSGFFDILPLGNRKRRELISRWYYLNQDTDWDQEIEDKIEAKAQQINVFLGNGASFIPAVPVFILGVLQNSDALNPTAGSQYGFLYEMLILKSLSVIADDYKQSGTYDIDVSLLSKLAFGMLTERKTYFTQEELEDLVRTFNVEQALHIKADEILGRMLKTRIVTPSNKYEKNFKFKYPYIYYYFSGRYIAFHYAEKEVQDIIEYMSKRLYIEAYGNIMIFVCHFANNENIILSIMINAYDTLSNHIPFDFHSAHPLFDDIQTAVEAMLPEHIASNEEVTENKERSLAALDSAGINDGHVEESKDEIDDEVTEKEKELADLFASLKILDVLGQILQNYPGGIRGDTKAEIISEMHRLGMRSIQALIETTDYWEEDLVNAIAEEAKKRARAISRDQVVYATHKFLVLLLSRAVRGMINKIAASMNSRFLLPVAQDVFSSSDSISAKLVLQELRINCLKDFSPKEVVSLYDDLLKRKELLACGVLRASVAHYLNYNTCDFKLRAQLCEKFDLSNRAVFLSVQKKKQS